ncbi:MAG: MFS transporter [Microbacteriaceae bacterium]
MTTPTPPRTGAAAGVVFLMYLGLMILNPIIAPLSRELGMAEWHLGAVVSVAALVMVIASPIWGRYGGAWGRRRVLLGTTISGTVAIAVFALIAQIGLTGALTPTTLVIAFVIVRGIWFGLSEAAVLPNVQAYIAESTDGPEQRLKGMSALGAAQGLSMVAGAAAGGLLAAVSPLVPLWATPALLLAAVVLVATRFTGSVQGSVDEDLPRKVRVLDPRAWPFLAIAFGTFTALGFMQMLIGFLIQDRLDTTTETTALLTGIALLGAGAGLFLSQAVVVPKSGWTPARLIRIGLLIAAVGFVTMLPEWGAWNIFAGVLLTGAGIGMVAPSVNAGISLAVDPDEQGSVAGLVGATNALTFVIAPIAATALYGIAPTLPLTISAITCTAALAFALTTRQLDTGRGSRSAGHDPRPERHTE